MTAYRFPASAAVLAILCAASAQTQEKKQDAIVMTHVKYDGLKQEVLKHRGKVVIVDFWASNCGPCQKAFPHFVEMHAKYADKGLVVITVSLDPADNEIRVKNANKFLTESKSPFRNLLLDEPEAFLEKQLDYAGLPFYYVFDRQGKWTRYRAVDYIDQGGKVPYDKMEKLVVQMLDEK
jgi:thiol-disulfide isomerase/thioredoxin